MANEHTITHFPSLSQHSYISPNLPGPPPKSSQGSLGPTVLLSLLFPVKYGLTIEFTDVYLFTKFGWNWLLNVWTQAYDEFWLFLCFFLWFLNNCLLVGCLIPLQNAPASPGQVCLDNCTCCHTDTEVAHQICNLTQQVYGHQAKQS